FQCDAPVRAGKQRPGPVARQALQLLLAAHPQVDHESALAHQFPGAGVEDGAATGGHHLAATGEHGCQQFPLAAAEAGLAFTVEDRGDVRAGAGLDPLVAVDEVQSAALGQATADGGLACPHWADQYEVGCAIHAAMLSPGAVVCAGLTPTDPGWARGDLPCMQGDSHVDCQDPGT